MVCSARQLEVVVMSLIPCRYCKLSTHRKLLSLYTLTDLLYSRMLCSARQLEVVVRSLVGMVMDPCRYYKCPSTEICSLFIPRLTCCVFIREPVHQLATGSLWSHASALLGWLTGPSPSPSLSTQMVLSR